MKRHHWISLFALPHFFRYPKRLHKVVRRLLPECQVRFVLSDCGSSKGAALVAAVAQRLTSLRRKVTSMIFWGLWDGQNIFLVIVDIWITVSLVFQLEETLALFRINQEQLQLVKTRMRERLDAGLKSKSTSTIKMLPSFVYLTPDGTGMKLKLLLFWHF